MKYQFKSNEELLMFLNEQLISAAEAAEILEVSKARIGHLVRDGKLTPAKEQPKMFLRDIVVEKKKELEELRKKYRPYDN
ncbi:helix-turn-helix domain-containing protein [Alkalihalobacillus sp. LMS39]|uniref:helix-turn-helix domain-containing protein n=1 Tax=Alkalihalobacillus sp. LMS39 TaxID=2924032 RepID=UPI001FB2FB5E|nr:helix-turn-helix domain-containing protein [Alkalihalobacillus sp. LMS39]UOE96089.1 helix-turn-helix domain-containing protein [Alkalihalobacillus sp. LMS39]